MAHLRYQSLRVAGQYPAINIRDQMKVIQGIFDIRMPHIPHKVREHGIHILPFPQPAVHVGIDKMVPEVIRPGAYPGIFFLWESSIPEAQEVLFQSAGTVWLALPVRKESLTVREQPADLAVVDGQIFCKFF